MIISQVTALGWVLAFPRVLTAPLLRAQGRLAAVVWYAVGVFAVTLVGAALTAGFGLWVIALAWVARQIVGLPWSFWAIRRYLGIGAEEQLRGFVRPLSATIVMAFGVWLVSHLLAGHHRWARLICEVATGAVIYPGALLLLDRPTFGLVRQLRHRPAVA